VDLRGRKWQEAEKDCIMRNFIRLTIYYTEDDDMSGGV
jgi:hypothetical protein